MKIIRTDSAEFEGHFRKVRERGRISIPTSGGRRAHIVEDVGVRGDDALFGIFARWDATS